MPDISIIIPVYNVSLYIGKCIESIINQTYKNIEIICVDDGSTDGSAEICDGYRIQELRLFIKLIKDLFLQGRQDCK